jgi:hypothetical protein
MLRRMSGMQSDLTDALQQRIRTALLARQAARAGGSVVEFLLGLGATLLMGVVVASVLTVIFFNFGVKMLTSFYLWFGIYLAVMVPLIYRHLRREGETVSGVEGMYSAGSSGEIRFNHMLGNAAGTTALLLWGPARVGDAIGRFFSDRHAVSPAVLEAAITICLRLYRSQQALPLKQLFHSLDTAVASRAALWLQSQGHADVSSDHKRMWLSSELRKSLNTAVVR